MLNINNAVPMWERLKNANKPIILYGMGDGAQKILNVMDSKGIKPSGFMASDEFVRGHSFAGFEVKSLAETEKQFGDFIVLVCFGTALPEVMQRITDIAAQHELYAPDVPVIGGGLFDKEYAEENEEKLNAVYNSLADEQSKKVFEGWLEYRISGIPDCIIKNQTDKSEAYELLKLSDNEIYADLGAYNGDTIEEFLQTVHGKFGKIYAFEPDARNYAKLKRRHYAISPYDFRTFNVGAWNEDCVKDFVSRGGRSSTLTPYEKGKPVNPALIKHIEMRSLDSVVGDDPVSLIKFDVEGSESEALDGCAKTIARYKPKLIISLYHRTEDMFALPLKIKEMNRDYRLYMRQHPYIPAWDMNLYCI